MSDAKVPEMDDLRLLHEAATPPKWSTVEPHGGLVHGPGRPIGEMDEPGDMAFTINWRNAAPAILRVLEAARAASDKSNCRCEPAWIDRGMHAPDCFWDYMDSYGIPDALAELEAGRGE